MSTNSISAAHAAMTPSAAHIGISGNSTSTAMDASSHAVPSLPYHFAPLTVPVFLSTTPPMTAMTSSLSAKSTVSAMR